MSGRRLQLIVTEDGSLSCLDPETGELHHNRAGAIAEARLNYTLPAAAPAVLAEAGSLLVLDACFGMGYNTWVLISELVDASARGQVTVVAVERCPEVLELASSAFANERLRPLSRFVLPDSTAPLTFGTSEFAVAGLTVRVEIRQGDLRERVGELTGQFDLVFHDPFSPKRAPELWTVDLFSHYFRLLEPRAGKVLTYSAAAAVRGGLASAGFDLYRTTALGGKSGGTMAAVPGAVLPGTGLYPLSVDELGKLLGVSGLPYRDAGLTTSRSQIVAARNAEQRLSASPSSCRPDS